MANDLKFTCKCNTVVFHAHSDEKLTVWMHGVVVIRCGVCGFEYEYASGTGADVSIDKGGSVKVSA